MTVLAMGTYEKPAYKMCFDEKWFLHPSKKVYIVISNTNINSGLMMPVSMINTTLSGQKLMQSIKIK